METGPTRRTRARSTAHNTDEKEYGAIDQCDNDQQYKEKQDAMRAEEDEFKDKLNQNEGDVDEISLSLEETNKLRISLGLKPLDTDATAPAAAGTTAHQDQQAVENFQKLEQQRIATEQKSAIALRLQKARQRILDLKRKQGQTIGGADTEEESTKDWVKRTRHNKPQSQQEVFDQFDADIERQYTSQDLKGLRVTHDISKLQNESDVVLTLADTNVLDENDDNLENIAIRDEDRLQKNIRARKRIRQSVSDEENEDDSLLSKYDNEKEKSGFLLDSKVSLLKATDRNEDSPSQILSTDVSNYDHDEHGDNKEPYSDYKSIKRKHRKDRKHKPKRTRNEDISEEYGQLADPARIEISHKVPENESFIDDEDLRQALAEERKHVFEQKQKRLNIDPIKLLKEYEALEQSNDIMPGDGLVIDSTSEFASTIKIENEAEQHMPVPQDFQISRDTTAESDAEMTDSTGNYVKAEPSYEPEIPRAVAQEELLVSGGVGAALALLRQKGIVEKKSDDTVRDNGQQRQEWLANLRRIKAKVEMQRRVQKEEDRRSGKLDRMSAKEREAYNKRENEKWERKELQLLNEFYRDYQPSVSLKYVDEFGNELQQKEAYKMLAHQFHGIGSGKMKTEKRLKKIEEKRKAEQAPIFDDAKE